MIAKVRKALYNESKKEARAMTPSAQEKIFDANTEDVIEIEEQPQPGTCRFRGKIHFSEGYHNLFESKFHQDRSTLHIIAAVLEKYPEGAYYKQHIILNEVPLVLIERNKKAYIFLQSEVE